MRGRIFAALTAAAFAAMPFRALVAGTLRVGLGLCGTLLVVGGCYLIAILNMLLNPVPREMVAERAEVRVTCPALGRTS